MAGMAVCWARRNDVTNRIEVLAQKHRRLDRLIDICKAAGRQAETQHLKRLRLRIKDALAAAQRRSALPST